MTSKYLGLLIAIVVVVVSSLVILGFYVVNSVQKPIIPENLPEYTFVIPQGQSIGEILTGLQRAGVPIADWPTRAYLKFHPELGRNVQAGEYTLVPGMTVVETLEFLSNGQQQESLTFIEGWRREEYVAYLLEVTGEDFAREFFELTEDREGRLFPDTYFVDDSTTPEKLLDKMTVNYEHKVEPVRNSGLLEEQGLTEDEALILASIVEREVADPTDQVIVAGILIKRLQNSWPLETDATVQYTLATEKAQINILAAIADPEFVWWPKTLTEADLAVDSPYNTRRNPGLPPGPISNPGLSAIAAVAEPLTSPYWFYLTDRSGVTRFAETLAEHNQNIDTFGVSE